MCTGKEIFRFFLAGICTAKDIDKPTRLCVDPDFEQQLSASPSVDRGPFFSPSSISLSGSVPYLCLDLVASPGGGLSDWFFFLKVTD